MKALFSSALLVLICFSLSAQQSLEFNQALIIDDNLATVPAGKVWKVNAIYGEESRYEQCVDISQNSTDELNRIRCAYTINSATTYYLKVPFYTISKMIVNGTDIISSINGFSDGTSSIVRYSNSTCTSGASSVSRQYFCTNKPTDPNLLPVWLPAGTTLASGGPNTFVSVIEFNVIP
jgi:hypothetical protein